MEYGCILWKDMEEGRQTHYGFILVEKVGVRGVQSENFAYSPKKILITHFFAFVYAKSIA